MYGEVMVLMPHRMVCFWTGSGPILEKFDLGNGGVSSLSQLSSRFLYFHFGGKKCLCLLDFSLWLWPIRSVTGRDESSWQKPLSAHQHRCMTWEDSQTFFSQEISFLAQPVFKWVLCHFSVADSNLFGSPTWLCSLEEVWRGSNKQIQSL